MVFCEVSYEVPLLSLFLKVLLNALQLRNRTTFNQAIFKPSNFATYFVVTEYLKNWSYSLTLSKIHSPVMPLGQGLFCMNEDYFGQLRKQ